METPTETTDATQEKERLQIPPFVEDATDAVLGELGSIFRHYKSISRSLVKIMCEDEADNEFCMYVLTCMANDFGRYKKCIEEDGYIPSVNSGFDPRPADYDRHGFRGMKFDEWAERRKWGKMKTILIVLDEREAEGYLFRYKNTGTPDGRYEEIHDKAEAIHASTGKPVRIIGPDGVLLDTFGEAPTELTEIKRLREENAKLIKALDNIRIGSVFLNVAEESMPPAAPGEDTKTGA